MPEEILQSDEEMFNDWPECQKCHQALYLEDGCEWPEDKSTVLCHGCTDAALEYARLDVVRLEARENLLEQQLWDAQDKLAAHLKKISEKDFDGNASCDYCHGIGACPRCWGRAGITRLENEHKSAGAELRHLFSQMVRGAVTNTERGSWHLGARDRTAGAGAMKDPYSKVKDMVFLALEEIPRVRGTTSEQYLEGLEGIQDEVDNWFECSIEAAKGDIKRAAGD